MRYVLQRIVQAAGSPFGAWRARCARLASPLLVYDLFDRLKSKSLARGLPLGRCVFPATRLHAARYWHPFGMLLAERLAADQLRGS